jgi:hypothetical protein
VNAESEEKSKGWESEDISVKFNCEKANDECKGKQLNKNARDFCNDFSDSKCKKAHN